jgi:chemotaxis protein MotB
VAERRRHSRSPEPSAERWAIPYADMLTLLFALFTLLYASSAVDAEKAQQLADSLRESFGSVPREQGTATPAVLENEAIDPSVTEEDQAAENLAGRADGEQLDLLGERVRELAQAGGQGSGIGARRSEEGLVISLAEALFFDSPGAGLPQNAQATLAQVARLLEGVPNHVRVEGHTDGEPPSAGFRSNWELSAARAVAVLEALEAAGVQPHRLSASGFADQRPLMSDDTAEGRRLNRRVDLVVLRASSPRGS